MGYVTHIVSGMGLAHRYWQLLVVQVAAVALSILALAGLVGVPALVLAIVLGARLDSAGGLVDMLAHGDIARFFLESIGAVLVMALSISVFVCVAVGLWLLVTAGTAGTLGLALKGRITTFSMGVFRAEAARFFFPMARYFTVIGVLFLGLVAGITVLALTGVSAYGAVGLAGSKLGVFFAVMGVLILGSSALFFSAVILLLTQQGIAPLVLEERGAWASLRKAQDFLDKSREGLVLLIILLGGSMLVSMAFYILSTAVQAVPLFGQALSLPVSVAGSLAGIYLGFIITATIMDYYYKASLK